MVGWENEEPRDLAGLFHVRMETLCSYPETMLSPYCCVHPDAPSISPDTTA